MSRGVCDYIGNKGNVRKNSKQRSVRVRKLAKLREAKALMTCSNIQTPTCHQTFQTIQTVAHRARARERQYASVRGACGEATLPPGAKSHRRAPMRPVTLVARSERSDCDVRKNETEQTKRTEQQSHNVRVWCRLEVEVWHRLE